MRNVTKPIRTACRGLHVLWYLNNAVTVFYYKTFFYPKCMNIFTRPDLSKPIKRAH